ncbi:phage portal protein, partial [Campylobacter jejuni]|nr:phage portal protein [Campylobacter jejuni]
SYAQTTSANKNSQFLESKQFQVIEIARLFNIPPHKLGDLSRATFSNIEQQETNYMVQTITPLTTKIEQALNRFLLNQNERKEFYFKFNINAILRADSSSRWESYVKALSNGVMSINEVRALEEMNPIDNGNDHLIPLNLAKIDEKDTQKGNQ